MKKSNKVVSTRIQEESKMKKFIVEVEEPKAGEEVSTGGVRRNGKMASQFKNPVPYEEPKHAHALMAQKLESTSLQNIPTYTAKERMKDEAKNLAADIAIDLMRMLWYRYGEPIIEAKLTQAVERLSSSPQETSKAPINSFGSTVIDVEEDELAPVDGSCDKIVKFPTERMG